MSARPTVLDLIESRSGVTIDERKLSTPLYRKITQLQRALAKIDFLRDEIEEMNQRGIDYLAILLITLALGAAGLILGLTGLIQGYLGAFQVVVSLVAATIILAADYYIALAERNLRSLCLVNIAEVARLSIDFDARLENLAREVAYEQFTKRGRTSNAATQPWPQGEWPRDFHDSDTRSS